MEVVLPEVTPLEVDLSYPEHPIKILDQKDRITRRKTTMFFKIQWSNHSEEEATWESEDFLCCHHLEFELPYGGNVRLFIVPLGSFLLSNLRIRFCFRGEDCDTPCFSSTWLS
jgi:hypothetical protein